MRAAVNLRYGGPEEVEVREVPKPEPGTGDVLVKVHATTVSRSDDGLLRAHPFFIRAVTGPLRPRQTILGMDFAGEVEAVGSGVTSFAPGDRVFGLTPGGYGGHAEYLCLPETGEMALLPAGQPFDEAVVCEGALYANSNLVAAGLRAGQRIMVYGASGAIGTAAVQLGKIYGAQVTAVVATKHLDLAESLGADRVIDYTAEDFTQIGETFDMVFDAVGKTSYFHCRGLLKPSGVFAATDLGPWAQNVLLPLGFAIVRKKRVMVGLPKQTQEFVRWLSARMGSGEFRAVIDRTYCLDDIQEAYRYVRSGQKTGIVVVEVVPGASGAAQSPSAEPPSA